jgi:hypothetical protein
MCLETIRVKTVELAGSCHIRCAGTIHGAYLHTGPGRRKLLDHLLWARDNGAMIDVEVVHGAIVKVYGRSEKPDSMGDQLYEYFRRKGRL